MGQDTHILIRDAHGTLYMDREGLVRIMTRQEEVNVDLDKAHGVVIAIERQAFCRKLLLYIVIIMLGLCNALLLFYKVFY